MLVIILWLNIELLFIIFCLIFSRPVTLSLIILRFLFFAFNLLLSSERKFLSSLYLFLIVFLTNYINSTFLLESNSNKEKDVNTEKVFNFFRNHPFYTGILCGLSIYFWRYFTKNWSDRQKLLNAFDQFFANTLSHNKPTSSIVPVLDPNTDTSISSSTSTSSELHRSEPEQGRSTTAVILSGLLHQMGSNSFSAGIYLGGCLGALTILAVSICLSGGK